MVETAPKYIELLQEPFPRGSVASSSTFRRFRPNLYKEIFRQQPSFFEEFAVWQTFRLMAFFFLFVNQTFGSMIPASVE